MPSAAPVAAPTKNAKNVFPDLLITYLLSINPPTRMQAISDLFVKTLNLPANLIKALENRIEGGSKFVIKIKTEVSKFNQTENE